MPALKPTVVPEVFRWERPADNLYPSLRIYFTRRMRSRCASKCGEPKFGAPTVSQLPPSSGRRADRASRERRLTPRRMVGEFRRKRRITQRRVQFHD